MDFGLGTLIGGGISAIGSLIGNIGGNKKALEAVDKTNQANKELADLQYQYNLDMWNRQNEYNSPVQQMQRLKEAGLNPNLMYGQGSTGNASSAPQYDAPQLQAYTGFGDFGASQAANQLMQGISGYANIKKTEAETNQIRQNTQNMAIQGEGFELRNAYQMLLNSSKETENSFLVDLIRSKIANIDSSTVSNFSSASLHDVQKEYTQSQKDRFDILTPLVKQQVETSLEQALFNLYKLSPAKLENILADTALKGVTAKLTSLNSKAIFNELEFGEKSVSWNLYKRDYDSTMMEFEKSIKNVLLRNGINLKGSNWFTPLLYEIEKYIALPIEQLIK